MKFDLIFSNPPYNKNIDIKILNEIIDVADEFIIIHPSTWLLDVKKSFNLYNEFRSKIDGEVKSVVLFNGCKEFGITVNTPIVITHIDKNYNGKANVNYFDTQYTVDSIYDVTKFGSEWFTIIKPFMNQLIEYCVKNGSVWDKKVDPKLIDQSKFYCQLADIIGHVNLNSNTHAMVKDDFYTMTIKNSDINNGIRKDTIKNTYVFDNEIERTNFLKYCNTDFARFCIAIYKNNTHIDSGEMELVPWLDFTEEWNDEKLFEKFDVSQELQDYIIEFLPDYYGIRN